MKQKLKEIIDIYISILDEDEAVDWLNYQVMELIKEKQNEKTY